MQKRTLGRSGLEVSALGFGCMGISFGYGPATRRERLAHEFLVDVRTVRFGGVEERDACIDRRADDCDAVVTATDRIDLLYQHRIDPDVPIDEAPSPCRTTRG